jgi:16S rRNA A1518/A1519 N6-dimethyltransferase RsmA/KsgA/DIM1 with predicted DNA glycosylase/AP lyase activity
MLTDVPEQAFMPDPKVAVKVMLAEVEIIRAHSD